MLGLDSVEDKILDGLVLEDDMMDEIDFVIIVDFWEEVDLVVFLVFVFVVRIDVIEFELELVIVNVVELGFG